MSRTLGQLTDAEKQEAGQRYLDGDTASELADRYDVKPKSMASWLWRAGYRREDTAETIRADAQILTHKSEASRYKRLYKEAVQQLRTQELLEETIREVTEATEVN